MAAPSFVAKTVPLVQTGTGTVAKTPAATEAGNLVLAYVEVGPGVEVTITMPPEWTKIGQIQSGSLAEILTGAWFFKIASVNGVEETDISWGTILLSQAAVAVFKKVNQTSPIAASALQSNGTSTTETFASVTPGQLETLSVLAGLMTGTNNGTPPEKYTTRQNMGAAGCFMATKELEGAGETGAQKVSLAIANSSLTAHIALAPEPAAEEEEILEETILDQIDRVAPPLQLAVIAIAEGGRGEGYNLTDEITNLQWSNVNPGGDEVCTFTIGRSWFAKNPEVAKGNLLRLVSGIDVLWQGRVEEIDRSTGDAESLAITCYGLGNRLGDVTFREIYVDPDFSKWGAIPNERVGDLGTSWITNAGSVDVQPSESGTQALVLSFLRVKNSNPPIGLVESWYPSGGIPIGEVYFNTKNYDRGAGGYGKLEGSWVSNIFLQTTTLTTGLSNQTNLLSSPAGTIAASQGNCVYAAIQVYFNAATVEAGVDGEWRVEARRLAVYGRHGLARKGEQPYGFSADQIVGHILQQASGISARRIDVFAYVIPRFLIETPTTPKDAISQVNEFANANYGTWGPNSPFDSSTNGYFDYTQPDLATQHWVATREDFEGDLNFHTETSSLYDTVDVSYTDEAGVAHVERFSTISPDLKAAGLSPRVFPLDLGTTTKANAQVRAEVFLSLFAGFAPARGSGTLSGTLRHYRRGELPAFYARADGSNIRIPNILPAETTFALDSSPDRRTTFPIKRVSVDASGDVPKTSIEFDQSNDSMAVLLAQEAAQAALVG